MLYQEFAPAPALRPFIRRYGILEVPEVLPQLIRERVMPMPGQCWVFPYSCRRPLYIDDGVKRKELPAAFSMVQSGQSYHWTHNGGFCLFFVLFKPGRINPFVYTPQESGHKKPGPAKAHGLHRQILQAGSVQERISAADIFFKSFLPESFTQMGFVQEALHQIHLDPRVKLVDLSKLLLVSPRHLRRTFKEQIGLSLKNYQQIIRISQSIHQLNEGKFEKISDVAFRWGYYDQNHFNRAFKGFTGLTPGRYLAGDYPVTSLWYWREGVEMGAIKK